MKSKKYIIIIFSITIVAILGMKNLNFITGKQNTSNFITKLVENHSEAKTVSVTFKNTGSDSIRFYKGDSYFEEIQPYSEKTLQLEVGVEYEYIYELTCSMQTIKYTPTEEDEGKTIEVHTDYMGSACGASMFSYSLQVNKEWKNDEKNISTRPDSVKIKVSCSTQNEFYMTTQQDYDVTLNEQNNWQQTVYMMSSDTPTCTINEETQLDNYEVSYSQKSLYLQSYTYTTVTNTYTGPKNANIKIKKEWLDESEEYRPEEVIVEVECPSKTEEIKLNKANNWEATYSIESNEEEVCKLTEKTIVNNYKRVDENTTFKAQDGNEVVIKNEFIKPEDTSIEVVKKWVDEDNKNETRPASIKIILKANGQEISSAELNESNSWKHTFIVPKTDNYGNIIEYTIDEENTPEGYDKVIDGFTITNTYTGPKNTNIKIKKEWLDESEEYRPEEVIVEVECPSKTEEIKLNKANNWEATYSIESNEEEVCKLTEKTIVNNYKRVDENTTFKAQDGNEVVIKNEFIKPEDTSIEVVKKWVDEDNKNETRPASIKIILKANGQEISSAELNESNSWKHTFIVPKTDNYGNIIEYTIDEENTPEGYDKVIDGFTITNTLKPILNPNTSDKIGIFFIILISLLTIIIYFKKKKLKNI